MDKLNAQVFVLIDDQWIQLKLTSFKVALTPEGQKFEITGIEEDEFIPYEIAN